MDDKNIKNGQIESIQSPLRHQMLTLNLYHPKTLADFDAASLRACSRVLLF